MTPIESIERFVCDNSDLKLLEHALSEFDAFTFLGVSDSETVHSNILAWLIDPHGSHSLGDFFLMNFLSETGAATEKEIHTIDWSKTLVYREWYNVIDGKTGFLDILVLNTDASFVCGIENKISSEEHNDQLTRYRKAIEQRYGHFSKSYLFISPKGASPRLPIESELWTPVEYRTILRLVDMILADSMDPEDEAVVSFLKQYTTTLRRNIVPDSNLKQLATKIYLTHREAIDLIWRHRESYIEALKEVCEKEINQHGRWHSIGRSEAKLVGFHDVCWKDFEAFYTGKEGKEIQSQALILLDFDFRQLGKMLLNLTIQQGEDETVREKLYYKTQGRYPSIFNHRSSPLGGRYHAGNIRLYESTPILLEADLMELSDDSVRSKISAWMSDFTENEFSKMNEIIVESFSEIESEHGQHYNTISD